MIQRSYSLQKVNYSQRSSSPKRIQVPRPRLNFPLPGDPNLYAGFGRKHYHQQFKEAPSPLLRRNESQNNIFIRNTLDVRDIQGAYPSKKPQSERNKLKNIQFLSKSPMHLQIRKKTQTDSLQKLTEEFDLRKSFNPEINKNYIKNSYQKDYSPIKYQKPDIIKPIQFSINQQLFENLSASNNGKKSSPRSFNPTYLSNVHMY